MPTRRPVARNGKTAQSNICRAPSMRFRPLTNTTHWPWWLITLPSIVSDSRHGRIAMFSPSMKKLQKRA